MKFIHKPGILFPNLEQAMEFFSNAWNPAVFDSPEEERSAFSQGIKIIQDYYQKNNPSDTNIIDLESHFQIAIGEKENPHIVSGIIDRIDKTTDGYETTRKMPAQEKVDQDIQLSIYLKAFLSRYPKEIAALDKITVSLYYLKHGVKLSSRRTLEQLQKSEDLFLDIIKLIETGKFDPNLSPLCDWCGYQNLCPMWKHKFKELRKIDSRAAEQSIAEYIELKSAINITKDRLEKIQEEIIQYMDQEGVERVFGENGLIAKTLRKTYKYDEKKIKEILEPLGKWEAVLKVDGIALKNILTVLPSTAKEALEKAKTVNKETYSLTVKKGKNNE